MLVVVHQVGTVGGSDRHGKSTRFIRQSIEVGVLEQAVIMCFGRRGVCAELFIAVINRLSSVSVCVSRCWTGSVCVGTCAYPSTCWD